MLPPSHTAPGLPHLHASAIIMYTGAPQIFDGDGGHVAPPPLLRVRLQAHCHLSAHRACFGRTLCPPPSPHPPSSAPRRRPRALCARDREMIDERNTSPGLGPDRLPPGKPHAVLSRIFVTQSSVAEQDAAALAAAARSSRGACAAPVRVRPGSSPRRTGPAQRFGSSARSRPLLSAPPTHRTL